jgi:hypothetical protein
MLSRVLMLAAAALLAAASPVEGQAPDLPAVGQAGRLRVYLDCNHICFEDYLRDEITFVDFVRQPQDADVHVLAVSNETGGGGREIVLRFVGRERFAGHDEELRAITLSGDTEATRRELVLRTVEVALLAFMARDGFPSGVLVEVDTPGGSGGGVPAGDPWSGWVFSVRTSADYSAEESTRDRSWDLNLGADRVTDAWKLTFGTSFDYSTEEFDLDEGDPLKAVRRERQTDWFVARSWGPHWSVGLDGQFRSSTFGNTKFSFETAPAIEYSVFPYEEYATRQLRLQYSLGVAHAQYNEITIFDQLDETHPLQKASATFERQETWGTIETRLEFSQYLHDAAFYRLEVNGDLSFRITRGLSVTFEVNASRIRDQLSLPRRDATDEEVLLRLRELRSAYRFSVDVGIRYSFGSLFNNVVNPRFGR